MANPFVRATELAAVEDDAGWRPEILRASVPGDRERLARLFDSGRVVHVHDRIQDQLRELVRIDAPHRAFTRDELDAGARAHLRGTPPHDYGVWVYYAWSGRLVHLLDAHEFARVRTDRNRNKITCDEQLRLAELEVGVIGLSVGQSVALALALERSFGQLRIADFDELALSNLNRIRSPLHRLGTNKAVAVAREIAEIDPFLDVVVHARGVTPETLDEFLLEGGKLDVLVDECDGIGIKLLARARARELGIAVVMDTSDRGMLDVERFDLEPGRPILHGLVEHLDRDAAMRARTDDEKLPFVAAILGVDTMSVRMKASLLEVEQTLTTWPQLASAVMHGGALAADAVRRIALGQMRGSGRWFVDLEQIVGDDTPPGDAPPPLSCEPVLDLAEMRSMAARIDGKGGLDEATARWLAEAGAVAPSAGNLQPWRFLSDRGRLLLFHAHADSHSVFDPDHAIAHIGLGACIENVLLAASAMGLGLSLQLFPLPADPRLCACLDVARRGVPADPLADAIQRRCTNRRHGDARPLEDDVVIALIEAVGAVAAARVHIVDERDRLDALAAICGAAERFRFLHTVGHRELFRGELRWQPGADVGLDVDTLELDAKQRIGLQMAADPRVVELLRQWEGGRGFTELASDAIRSSSAMALVSMDADDAVSRIHGGRAAQRLWLAATREDVAVHPISAPIFLGRVAEHCEGFANDSRHQLVELFERTRALFDCRDRTPLFLVRLSRADPPSARSRRRPWPNTFFPGGDS